MRFILIKIAVIRPVDFFPLKDEKSWIFREIVCATDIAVAQAQDALLIL